MKRLLTACLLILSIVMITAFAVSCDEAELTEETTAEKIFGGTAPTEGETTTETPSATEPADTEPVVTEEETTTAPSIPADVEYSVDNDEHWVLSESGEKLYFGKHTTENGICEVCRASIQKDEYGSVYLNLYDKHGNVKYQADYGSDGTLFSQTVIYNTYDDNFVLQNSKILDESGNVSEITEYAQKGNSYRVTRRIIYFSNGCYSISDYDEYENILRSEDFTKDGKSTHIRDFSYMYNEHGQVLNCIETFDGFRVGEYIYQIPEGNTEPGAEWAKTVKLFSMDGTSHTYIFDKNGNVLARYFYWKDGVPDRDEEYKYLSDGSDTYLYREVRYEKDGSVTETIYGENGGVISKTKK